MSLDVQFYSGSYSSELSFMNKLGRLLWGLVWATVFRWSFRPMFAWRRFLLKVFRAQVASTAAVYPSARIWAPWNLEMGERSVLGDYVDCYSVDRIVLEADVTVSQYTFLCTASHDIESPDRTLLKAPIVLRRGSWVFAGSFVGMGVTVGEGAVVAACSVVVKDVDPFTVVGGNPANFLKERNASWVERVQ